MMVSQHTHETTLSSQRSTKFRFPQLTTAQLSTHVLMYLYFQYDDATWIDSEFTSGVNGLSKYEFTEQTTYGNNCRQFRFALSDMNAQTEDNGHEVSLPDCISAIWLRGGQTRFSSIWSNARQLTDLSGTATDLTSLTSFYAENVRRLTGCQMGSPSARFYQIFAPELQEVQNFGSASYLYLYTPNNSAISVYLPKLEQFNDKTGLRSYQQNSTWLYAENLTSIGENCRVDIAQANDTRMYHARFGNLSLSFRLVSDRPFQYSNIRYLSADSVSIGQRGLYILDELRHVDLPECLSIENYGISQCPQLQSVNLPQCAYVGKYAFQRNTVLTSISLPACTSMEPVAVFQGCSALTNIDLGPAEIIDGEISSGTWLSGTGSANEGQYLDIYMGAYGIRGFQKLKGFPFGYMPPENGVATFTLTPTDFDLDEDATVLNDGTFWFNRRENSYIVVQAGEVNCTHTFIGTRHPAYVSAFIDYNNASTSPQGVLVTKATAQTSACTTTPDWDGTGSRYVAFCGCKSIGAGGTSQPSLANMSCLQVVFLDSDVTDIPDYAFMRATEAYISLNSSKISSIGSYAFAYTWRAPSKMSELNPDGISSIGSYAFGYTYWNSSYVFDVPVADVNANAFTGQYGMSYAYFNSDVQNILTVANFPFGLITGMKSALLWKDTTPNGIMYAVKSSSVVYSKVILLISGCYIEDGTFSISVGTPGYSNGNYSVYFGDDSSVLTCQSGKCVRHTYSRVTSGANLSVALGDYSFDSSARYGEFIISFSDQLTSFDTKNLEVYYADGNVTAWGDGSAWTKMRINNPTGDGRSVYILQNLVQP